MTASLAEILVDYARTNELSIEVDTDHLRLHFYYNPSEPDELGEGTIALISFPEILPLSEPQAADDGYGMSFRVTRDFAKEVREVKALLVH